MKIKDLKTYIVENPTPTEGAQAHGGGIWIFVKLITDNGIEGIGEPWNYGFEFAPKVMAQMIEAVGERYVIGTDPFQIEKMWRSVYATGQAMARMCILSAIDQACWDIIGKALDQPIYNLLGGKYHEKIRSYTFLYPSSAKADRADYENLQMDPIKAAERSAEYVKLGFTAIKLDPCRPAMVLAPYQLSLETLENAEAVVKNIREAVGDKCDILIGTHGQMTTSSAIRLARRLEKYDPLWFEEPVPPENKNEMARVAHHTTIPVATGEKLYTKYDFRDLLENKAATILQFALGRVGGILEAKKIAGMAEAYYAQIAPHLYAGPVEAMADIQVDICSPNALIQESIERFDGFHAEILKKPIRWENGYIIPPTEPGLGIELNEEVVNKHLYKGN
jgi:galactonate dehydratase